MKNFLSKIFCRKQKFKIKTKSLKKFNCTTYKITANNITESIIIITKAHTFFPALGFSKKLFDRNISSEIMAEYNPKNADKIHIVYCPQSFDILPPKFIAYQTEQTISDKWFQPEHMKKLRSALSIIDYSENNLDFFIKNGFDKNKLFHFPFCYFENYKNFLINQKIIPNKNYEKKYDVVFYGDPRCERRKAYLNELSKDFDIKIICGVFGTDVITELLQAKTILNIHFFEGALLEICRISEALSLGCHVLSEAAVDQDKHDRLTNIVDFVEIDDIQAMKDKLSELLENPEYIKSKADICKKTDLISKEDKLFNTWFNNDLKKHIK
jgi:glycosyltransferase involved in cell wall biosynthesis